MLLTDGGMQEFETLLRFSGAGKAEAVRGLKEGPELVALGAVHGTGKSADDTRLRYSASSAVTNGLEECMEEAEHEGGTNTSASLEGAVLAILREIGEDPGREVRMLHARFTHLRFTHSIVQVLLQMPVALQSCWQGSMLLMRLSREISSAACLRAQAHYGGHPQPDL